MPDLVEAASAILAQAERRTEIVGENIANASAPAYKRRIAFSSLVSPTDASRPVETQVLTAIDFGPGKLVETNNPYDFAIAGTGFFALRQGEDIRFSRAGRFTRRNDGRLVDTLSGVLQQANGGDVIVSDAIFEVRSDGQIFQDGSEIGKVAIYDAPVLGSLVPISGGFSDSSGSLGLSAQASVKQGTYEASNVSTGEEMVTMMQALRMAESGQRVMIIYDDLMGRVISTFGENVR